MKKITAKTTKKELKDILNVNVKAVKEQDKDLYDRICYAGKMSKEDDSKVTRTDLASLVKEVIKLLGDKLVEPQLTPVAENSVKLKGGTTKVKEEVVEKSEKTAEKEEPKAEKTAKKSLGKKKDDDTKSSKEEVVQNDIFPEEMTVDGVHYKLAHDITSMEDLLGAIEKDETIFTAFHWTKTDLKKYPYFPGVIAKNPKSFEHNLDLASALYVSEHNTVAYFLSTYTEGCYNLIPDDFEEVEGIRYAGMMSYQIYRAV